MKWPLFILSVFLIHTAYAQKGKNKIKMMVGYHFQHYKLLENSDYQPVSNVEHGVYHGLNLNSTFYYSSNKTAPFLQVNTSIFNKSIDGLFTPRKYERYSANYNGTYLNFSGLGGISFLNKKKNRFNFGMGVRGLGLAFRNGWLLNYQAKAVVASNGNSYINYDENRIDYKNDLSWLPEVFTTILFQLEYEGSKKMLKRNLTYRMGVSNGGIYLLFGMVRSSNI